MLVVERIGQANRDVLTRVHPRGCGALADVVRMAVIEYARFIAVVPE